MTLEGIQIGKCYETGDDALYYVVAKGNDWFLAIKYSYNHTVASPIFYHESFLSEDYNENLKESDNDYIFDDLVYWDDFTLKIKKQ